MTTILVTGANGQLGRCLEHIHKNYPDCKFLFTSSKTLDITQEGAMLRYFEKAKPDYCINCAAYTRVEEAEKIPEKAFLINAQGAKQLATVCENYQTVLIHISTDYVFDGTKTTPYTEEDEPNPINAYGSSKLSGERYIQDLLKRYFIIRTSWLYSEFGRNFYKTILEKAKTQKEIHVTDQETGSPTNANDLAVFLIDIIRAGYKKYGIYHFCGPKIMTWYDFALSIIEENQELKSLKVVKTKNYHTFAKRPVYSALKSSIICFKDEKHSGK
ncbi:MAG: dTDP-4-dehydrorhamnose reductase [Bacteroidota bacterium]